MTTVQVLIGGVDHTGTHLMTPTTYDVVCEYKRRSGQVVPWSQRALVQMLEKDGLLLSTDTDGRHKAVLRSAGSEYGVACAGAHHGHGVRRQPNEILYNEGVEVCTPFSVGERSSPAWMWQS